MNQIAYIDFSNTTAYQALYSSQVYGTFFIIYGKIKTTPSNDNNNYLLSGIELKLVNFKGPINIGITQAKVQEELNSQNDRIGGRLIIEVQGVPEHDPSTHSVSAVIDGVGNTSTIVFPKKGSHLWIDRRLKRMHDRGQISEQLKIVLANVFDSEFKYREGTKKPVNVGKKPNEWGDTVALKAAEVTNMCPRAKRKVI